MDQMYGMSVEKVSSSNRSVVKGGRAVLTLLASPELRRHDRYLPDEGRFVFTTPLGFMTHFDPKQDNHVIGYVGQVINHDSNGLGIEMQKASSLVTLGENLFLNNGLDTIPSGSKFVVVTPDAITVFGTNKHDEKLQNETRFKKLYHSSVRPSKGRNGEELYPPLVLPYQRLFSETGLVKRTKNFWSRKYEDEDDTEDGTTHFGSIMPNNDEPVTLARSPALFVTSLRRFVGVVTKESGATENNLDGLMEELAKSDEFVSSLEGLLKASHAWHTLIPVFTASSTTEPGNRGTCQTKMG